MQLIGKTQSMTAGYLDIHEEGTAGQVNSCSRARPLRGAIKVICSRSSPSCEAQAKARLNELIAWKIARPQHEPAHRTMLGPAAVTDQWQPTSLTSSDLAPIMGYA